MIKKILVILFLNIFILSNVDVKANQNATWVAMVKHKDKKIFYASDNKIEINSKQKAINNATSKCWFDPNHKEGDWPSENCLVVYAKKITSDYDKEKKEFERKKIFKKATKEANKKWISENKQYYLDRFNKKLYEYESLISSLEINRKDLSIKLIDLKKFNLEVKEKIKDTFDVINNDNRKIKSIKMEIVKNEDLYLSSDADFLTYENKIKKIKEINFQDSDNFRALKRLIYNANKSKIAANFIGTKALRISGITIKQEKIGFIQEFDSFANRDLEFKSEENNIDKLSNGIEKNIKNINEYILKPIDNLFILDDDLLIDDGYNYLFMGHQFYSLYKLVNHTID